MGRGAVLELTRVLGGARFSAAKFDFSCVPSQKGFVLEWPQRQRAIVSLAS
jgi:hypothetical protein